MKCLILGGGGFLGSHLSEALIAEGHSVRIFERSGFQRANFPNSEVIDWVEGNFVDVDQIAGAITGMDVIYHLVSTTLPKSSNEDPVYDIETNVIGTLNLLELSRKTSNRKIIFVSSGGTIYGIPKEVPIKESHPTDPLCSYGIGKLTIEKYLHLYMVLHGIEYIVLRLGNPYGERQRISASQGAVAVFLNKALHDELIEIWGDGNVVRDYIYVGDAVRALSQAKSFAGKSGIFNIGAGQGRSLNEIIFAIEQLLGRPVRLRYLSARPFDVPVNVLDISRAKQCLNWEPRVSFEDGLRRTWQWMRSEMHSSK